MCSLWQCPFLYKMLICFVVYLNLNHIPDQPFSDLVLPPFSCILVCIFCGRFCCCCPLFLLNWNVLLARICIWWRKGGLGVNIALMYLLWLSLYDALVLWLLCGKVCWGEFTGVCTNVSMHALLCFCIQEEQHWFSVTIVSWYLLCLLFRKKTRLLQWNFWCFFCLLWQCVPWKPCFFCLLSLHVGCILLFGCLVCSCWHHNGFYMAAF